MKEVFKWVGAILTALVIFVAIMAAIIIPCEKHGNEYIEREYSLYDMGDGVYGYYTNVTSRAPASNYEMVTICANGSVLTLKGNVTIYYVEDDFRIEWRDKNYINRDDIILYVPHGSIVYQVNVSV